MFERLQKPFLTVETGEAYQPIRLTYQLTQEAALVDKLNELKCLQKSPTGLAWHWVWRDEAAALHFESVASFQKNDERPIRLGTLSIRDKHLYINLPSFKRACLCVPFFDRLIDFNTAHVIRADFINKVFGLDERLHHGFTELFNDDELEKIIEERTCAYTKAQKQCEQASSPEEALKILSEYTKHESEKRLPYAERYHFNTPANHDPDVAFLGFYIFLRGRELVAIRRWFGNIGYSLADAADETMEQVFGGMDIDILD
jgi:hypothetical protein